MNYELRDLNSITLMRQTYGRSKAVFYQQCICFSTFRPSRSLRLLKSFFEVTQGDRKLHGLIDETPSVVYCNYFCLAPFPIYSNSLVENRKIFATPVFGAGLKGEFQYVV